MKELKDRICETVRFLTMEFSKWMVLSIIKWIRADGLVWKGISERFANFGATKVLTAEISGIAPALTTAFHLGLSSSVRSKNKTGHHARSSLSHAGTFAYQRPHGGIDRLAGVSHG